MNRNKAEQENYCLQVKTLCDLIRTKLFEIEDFDEFEKYDKIIKKLKNKVNSIYWEL